MKKYIAIFLAVIMLLICTACTVEAGDVGQRFEVVSSWRDDTGAYRILVDKETNVEYLWYKDNNIYGQTLTVLLDSEGNPIIYDAK